MTENVVCFVASFDGILEPKKLMTFVASFILSGELYGVSDNNEIFRWDLDEAKWVKVGSIDRDG